MSNCMRKCVVFFLLAALSLSLGAVSPRHVDLPAESLDYKVMFKWGLINKQAGSANLTLKPSHDGYHSILTARSVPWADKFYKVRDTLLSDMAKENFRPLRYEKIANEASDRKHDIVLFKYTPGVPGVRAETFRKVITKGELKKEERLELKSDSLAVDMLSSFYLMRTLPFESMSPGDTYKVPIFSGKQKELLSIKYQGIHSLKIDNVEYPTYHITFIFTSKGGKKSSDDMDAWISTDSKRIPLRLEGKLPVGKVHCIYTGQI